SALEAIERERFRSYSHLVRNLHWLAAALVAAYPWLVPSEHLYFVGALALAMVLYTLALHSPFFARSTADERMWTETGIDLCWITCVIIWSHLTASPLFFLYYIVIYASTPATSGRQTYLKAGLATLLALGIVFPLDLMTNTSGASWLALLANLAWPLTGLWLVAYFSAESGTLGANLHRSLFLAAHTDALTGLPNLRYFTAAADLRGKLGGFYTIVMVDADNLKRVNDTHGHALGSELIRTVADAIRNAARSGDDLCSRIGGDEFIVRLAGASDAGALAYCRRVRTYLAEHPLKIDGSTLLPISVSMGIAAHPKHGRTLSEVTDRADKALYRSKQEGRARDHVWAA
ncbi:MAG TPA: GGDEF domain-containing protein, partial [Thermoanaerobaculia bacterium]